MQYGVEKSKVLERIWRENASRDIDMAAHGCHSFAAWYRAALARVQRRPRRGAAPRRSAAHAPAVKNADSSRPYWTLAVPETVWRLPYKSRGHHVNIPDTASAPYILVRSISPQNKRFASSTAPVKFSDRGSSSRVMCGSDAAKRARSLRGSGHALAGLRFHPI